MIDNFLNVMRQQASFVGNNIAYLRLGIVTSFNPDKFTIRAKILPEDENPANNLTGDLPIVSSFVGNGWGMVAAPAIGDMCVIDFQQANYNNGVVIGFLYDSKKSPPAAPSKEFWLVHETGSYLKFKNNGDVEINAKNNCKINAKNADIKIEESANVEAGDSVNVTASSINLGESEALASALKALINTDILPWLASHQHSNGNDGNDTGAPTSSPPNSSTSIVKAA